MRTTLFERNPDHQLFGLLVKVNIGLRVWITISISTKRELLVFCEVKTTHRLMKSAATASTSSGAELIAIYTPAS